ncbi:M28 family metallopeptidase [Roseivirga echinicomitans]|nr:M20/M25/M40 family metallo-hydrolase [Roseivirga echinicomitans]
MKIILNSHHKQIDYYTMKKPILSLITFFIASSLSITSCQTPYEITQDEVTRVVTTLASDDMGGRMIFTPGIEKASQFIQEEFKKAGLEYLEGMTSYDQQFDIYSIAPESMSASLNGKAVDAADMMAMSNSEGFDWTNVADLNVRTIGADDNFQTAYNEIRRGTGKNLVLVNSAHKDLFERYKGFSSRGSRVVALDPDNATVMVISNLTAVTSVDIEVQNAVTAQSLSNVTGKISGNRANEIVLFGAHYDHIGVREGMEGDNLFNGANDDASGTTAVIELAKYFAASGKKPERTIVFVAFTAEESGGYGSRHFSEQLNPDEIVAMFNIEMIGKGAKEGPNTAWITGFEKSSFGKLLQDAVEGTEYTFYPDPYPTQNLFYRSDNATLARLGVPAHSISTTQIDIDEDYHKATDEVSTLDMAHMTNTIKAIAKAAEGMISGAQTPTRVDPSGLR